VRRRLQRVIRPEFERSLQSLGARGRKHHFTMLDQPSRQESFALRLPKRVLDRQQILSKVCGKV
jgi:hypothetical protein